MRTAIQRQDAHEAVILRMVRVSGLCSLVFAFVAFAAPSSRGQGTRDGPAQPFRVGFSVSMFADVNENDATAAATVWAVVLGKERGLDIHPRPLILRSVEAMREALASQKLEALALPITEYWSVRALLDDSSLIAASNDGDITETYVLVVHKDSGIAQLDELHDRRLAVLTGPRMSLAKVWLDTLLLPRGVLGVAEYCQTIESAKLAKVVLSVFFRQNDACLVTERGLKTMIELNPQVGSRLQVIRTSPAVVPSGFLFRKDNRDADKELIFRELGKVSTTAAGTQVLTLFKTNRIEARPFSSLESAISMLELHDRLRREQSSAMTGIRASAPTPGVPAEGGK